MNTFSKIDNNDNQGYANNFRINGALPFGLDEKGQTIEINAGNEIRDTKFTPIQQYRAVEFDRDWNIRNRNYQGAQTFSNVSAAYKKKSFGLVEINSEHFNIGNSFSGLKSGLNGRWSQKGFNAIWSGSYLASQSLVKNQYLRHKIEVSQRLGPLKIGFKDDYEQNKFGDCFDAWFEQL